MYSNIVWCELSDSVICEYIGDYVVDSVVSMLQSCDEADTVEFLRSLVECQQQPSVKSFLHKYVNISQCCVYYYPRDAMLARVIAITTCLSVCLSVTRRYCVKTKKASGMISSLSVSPKALVFQRQISSPNSKGFPPNGSFKQWSVGKIQRFFSFKHQYLKNGSRYGQSYY